jgi:hypothetical protein
MDGIIKNYFYKNEKNSIEALVKNLIQDKNKAVREDILTGDANYKTPLPADSYIKQIHSGTEASLNLLNDEIYNNGMIIRNMLTSMKIGLTNNKRKNLVTFFNF